MRPSVRRWLIVAALSLVSCGMAVPLSAYGVFLPAFSETFGWSRGAVSSALSINLVVGGVAGFGIGALADRYGPRLMLVLTVILAGVSFALVSQVHALWQIYLLVGILGGVGTSSFYLLGAATVSRWFTERRGLALSLVLVGFNFGYVASGPLAAWLIATMGWRGAYLALSAGAGLVALIGAASVRLPREGEHLSSPHPAHASAASAASRGITLREALVDRRHWLLSASWLLQGALVFMVTVHIVPFARDRGINLAGASLALTAYGFGAIIGRVGSGVTADRRGTTRTFTVAHIVMGLSMIVLVWVPSRAVLLVSVALFGAGFAAADVMVAKVIPELFGLRAIGVIMGVLSLGWRAGAALGPAAAGFLFDLTGSYTIPFGLAPLGVLASWFLFTLATSRRRAR